MSEIRKLERSYENISAEKFFTQFSSEEAAREFVWLRKFGSSGFSCPKCNNSEYWEHRHNAEIRECTHCHHQLRLRTGTIFQNSKLPILTWLRALYFVTQDKRGVSALQLKRLLGMRSYGTTWLMLLKIRSALSQRDSLYKLKGVIEVDGAMFGRRDTKNQAAVFIGVEQRKWRDENGKNQDRAGFAKILVDREGQETKTWAKHFISQSVRENSTIKTDGRKLYKDIDPSITVHAKTVSGIGYLVDEHLPWVHKFISNAKRWILGTHHGIKDNSKYLEYYLAEYTYRFNRRHDPNSLLDRALTACVLANPRTQPMLCG